MFAVVVVHSEHWLYPIAGIDVAHIVKIAALLCDPIFFALSGYFAIRSLAGKSYGVYIQRKVTTVVLPLLVYSLVLYVSSCWTKGLGITAYIQYLYGCLSPWWFIPALLPCLVIAPALYILFERLSDDQIFFTAKFVGALALFAIVCCFLQWVFRLTGHETLERAVSILYTLVPVRLLSDHSTFLFFCLGYFFRRLQPFFSRQVETKLIVFGAIAWVLDIVFSYYSIDRIDFSYMWLFATLAVLLFFNRCEIKSRWAARPISWLAKRSYSVYLVQYDTIAIASAFVFDILLGGADAAFLPAISRVFLWSMMVFLAYTLAVLIAAVVDGTLLRAAQSLFESAARRAGRVRWSE